MRNGTPYPYLVGMHTGTVVQPARTDFPTFLAYFEGKAEPEVIEMIRVMSPLRLAELAEGAVSAIELHSPKAPASSVDAGIVENDRLVVRLILSELARRAEVNS